MNIHAYHSGHKKQHEMFNKLNEPSGFDKIDCVGKSSLKWHWSINMYIMIGYLRNGGILILHSSIDYGDVDREAGK